MDAQALENEAKSAISGAKTLDELDDARVRYLGRKSALKQALREVRDPETGRVLNALRDELEFEWGRRRDVEAIVGEFILPYDAVRKAAIKDQETAGIDIVSDGELRRARRVHAADVRRVRLLLHLRPAARALRSG